jgi:hypothetical protein
MESWYVVVSDGNERDYEFARKEKHRALAMYVLVFHKGLSREDRQDIRDKWVRAFTTSDAYGMENLFIFEEDRVFLPDFWKRILLHIDECHRGEWPLKRSLNGAPVAVFVTAENPCGFVCSLMERVRSMLVVIWLHSCSHDYKLASKMGDHGHMVCDGSFATMIASRRW